jgi:hypothetical protein
MPADGHYLRDVGVMEIAVAAGCELSDGQRRLLSDLPSRSRAGARGCFIDDLKQPASRRAFAKWHKHYLGQWRSRAELQCDASSQMTDKSPSSGFARDQCSRVEYT